MSWKKVTKTFSVKFKDISFNPKIQHNEMRDSKYE